MTKQVIVMRKDLNMRRGKQMAQASHASLGIFTQNMRVSKRMDGNYGVFYLTDDMVEWLQNSFTKVCVGCDSEEELQALYDAATAAGLPTILITDNGTTEFNGVKTNTCIAIGPGDAELIDTITGGLKLL